MSNGSCLNDEYTTMIGSIHVHLAEAQRLYNILPQCIKRSSNELCNHTETLGVILTKGVSAAELFKKEFNID